MEQLRTAQNDWRVTAQLGSILTNQGTNGLERKDRQSSQTSETSLDVVHVGESNTSNDGTLDEEINLIHRFRHDKTILVLSVAGDHVYAGTQGGEILVYSLSTFNRIRTLEAHHGAVLGFCLTANKDLLFSSGVDRFINVWDTNALEHQASIYSLYDVGDIFCVSYSTRLKVLYIGCQNTSLQWLLYKGDEGSRPPNPRSHPSFRQDRFFDSAGPGGVRTPRTDLKQQRLLDHKRDRDLEIPRENIHQFAHNGYIFAMLLAIGQVLGVQNQEVLITGGGDGLVKIWTIREVHNGEPRELHSLCDGKEDGNSVLSLVLDGTFLYSGRADGKVDVWDLETRQLLRSLKAHPDEILALSVLRGCVFSASTSGHVRSYSQRHEPSQHWRAHGGRVLATAQTQFKGHDVFLTGGNDNTIGVWDVTNLDRLAGQSQGFQDNKLFENLRAFVSYRTISSDPRYKTDCRRGASYLRSLFRGYGAITELLRTESDFNPVVYARFKGERPSGVPRRTILFYGHYDVIAAEDKQKKWTTDPFELTGMDGYFYGRGSSDNKGPIMAAVHAAAELFSSHQLVSDIVFLIEGEEECGSRGFQATVRQHRDLIGPIDWIILANSYWLDDELPCLTYGLRGVLHVQVEIESDEPDLHSGVDGSALLDEPLKDLAALIATLTGPKNRVAIPGFYDWIPPMTAAERSLYEDITTYLLSINPELGSPEAITDSIIKRTRDPSLTIHNFKTSGSEKSTIIPHHASAAISIRLVPNQSTDGIAAKLETFLHSRFAALGSKNKLTVKVLHRAEPWVADPATQLFKTLERAVSSVWATAPVSHPPRRPSAGIPKSPPQATSSTIAAATSPTSPMAQLADVDELAARLSEAVVKPPAVRTIAKNGAHESTNGSANPELVGRKPQTKRIRPLYVREGGSIPAVRFLETEFDAPAAHLPCGQASDHAHLDNERFRVLNLLNSREIFRRVFRELREGDGAVGAS